MSEKKSGSEFKKFEPFTLNCVDSGQIRQDNGWIGIKAGVGSQEVIVSDEEGSENDGAVDVFETAASAGVELVGTVEAFYKLFERSVLFGFIIIIREADDLETFDGCVNIIGIECENCRVVRWISIGDKFDG